MAGVSKFSGSAQARAPTYHARYSHLETSNLRACNNCTGFVSPRSPWDVLWQLLFKSLHYYTVNAT